MLRKASQLKALIPASLTPEQQRILQYIGAALLVVLLLALLLWKTVVSSGNERRFSEKLSDTAQAQQIAVSNFQKDIVGRAKEFTQNPGTITLVRQQSRDDLIKLSQTIKTSIPNTKSVNFYFPREAQQQKDTGGAIGFVELNMINRLELGETVLPEVSRSKDSKQWQINWAFPVTNQLIATNKTDQDNIEAPLAVLYFSTSTLDLEAALSKQSEVLAQTKLTQNIGVQRLLNFLSVGNGGGFGSKIVDIPRSHWQLEVSPSKSFVAKTSYFPLWIVLLLLIISVAACALAYYLADRTNTQLASLYKTLDINIGGKKSSDEAEAEEDTESQSELSNPIYLTDSQLTISEEDEAMVTGANQQKQSSSEAETTRVRKGIRSTQTNGAQAVPTPEHIFRAYDIRGSADSYLTPPLVEAIGKAIATEAMEQGEQSLLIGYDARTHSPKLRDYLQKGILSTGCNVIDIGLVPTPLLNFATIFSDKTSSGVIVTASHNPKTDNGFKIVLNEQTLTEEDIQRLKQRVAKGIFATTGKGEGTVETENFQEEYIDTISADIALNPDLKIVIDAANGASSELAPKVFEELSCEVETLFCEFNGEFPNHGPDPSIEGNLQALIEKVKEVKADIGLALDGDGDRLVIITPAGNIIWPDQLLMIFARDVVSRNPGCDVIYDIKCTRHLTQVISSYGGRPIMWKTGHSNIKTKMRETNALLGGEYSGHIFFKERWFGFDDGIYAAARLLEIMSLRDQSLDDMLDALPKLASTNEIKIPVTEESKFSIIKQLIERGDFSSGEKTTIDGLRVDFSKGWGLVRASNTSPSLTLRFEADNDTGVEQLKTLFKRELQKIDSNLPLDF